MKIAMLFQDNGIRDKDLSHPEKGNPGIGGTEYCFLMLAYYLQKLYGEMVELTMFHFRDNILPAPGKKVENIAQAFQLCMEENADVVLLKNRQEDDVYGLLEQYPRNYMIWCHNYLTPKEIRFFQKCDSVKRLICVGRQMYDNYLDDIIIDKMDFVFNMFTPPADKACAGREEPWDCAVTYVGSLIYQKNFHVLAAAWKTISKAVPQATLHVLGTGKLYDENAELGPLGIAEASYEEMFLSGITEDGKLMENVIFHGILGEEKYDLYRKTAVGVVNPMAATETFCLAAIEMEACGVPIVSRMKNGLLDTVKHQKTGLLYKNADSLADNVILLLKDKEKNKMLGAQALAFAHSAFLPEKIMPEWIRVLEEVTNGKKAVYRPPVADFSNNGKWLRRIWHGIHSMPFLRKFPSIHKLQNK
ncbi:MAG: glycosyltransferase family 4 protein [Lachnospiraceae bacterium]